jgi:hypothetical protein
MITCFDIYPLLRNEIPAMDEKLMDVNDPKSPYQLIRIFTDETLKALREKQNRPAKKCLLLAQRFLDEGEPEVRKAMELIFLPEVNGIFHKTTKTSAKISLLDKYQSQLRAVHP